jgi:hypothetical protein
LVVLEKGEEETEGGERTDAGEEREERGEITEIVGIISRGCGRGIDINRESGSEWRGS